MLNDSNTLMLNLDESEFVQFEKVDAFVRFEMLCRQRKNKSLLVLSVYFNLERDCDVHYLECIDKNQFFRPNAIGFKYAYVLSFDNRFLDSFESDAHMIKNPVLFTNGKFISRVSLENYEKDFIELLLLKFNIDYNRTSFFDKVILRSLFFEIKCWLNRKLIDRSVVNNSLSDTELVWRFLDLIEENFLTERNIGNYLKILNVSEKKLSDAVGRVFGVSAKQLVLRRIVIEAQRLLAFGDLSVKNTSDALGFEEVTYFVRFFQKQVGFTPGVFKKQYMFRTN